jgi:SAM-dependent methyltransferase
LLRVLHPEWLDVLPPQDARARRSRAELGRINRLMGNARCIARMLPSSIARIADLGAGDGRLLAEVARRSRLTGVHATLIDRVATLHPEALEKLARLQWTAAQALEDAHDFLSRPGAPFDAIVANLFLHHFEDAPLRRLLAHAARRAPLFIACEPRRSPLALHASRLLGLAGCSAVTRHDATVSVRAGFRGRELSGLWPDRERWHTTGGPAGAFGHLFVARRHAAL